MPARRFVRALYSRASGSRALGRPLAAIRSRPRVRAFARRHVQVLLGRGTTWANVDGALRLLAEDRRQRIVFGPWQGDPLLELLYWAPFVRWAQAHFSLDPARITVVSSEGAEHWYAGACGAYLDSEAGLGEGCSDAAVFPPEPVLRLIEQYRSGAAAPRPLLKRARHVLLTPPDDASAGGLPEPYVALALEPSVAFPASQANRDAARELTRSLSASGAVASLEQGDNLRGRHALLGRAIGLVAAWSGAALLGVLSGVPTIALTSSDGTVCEPDLDLALRVAGELGSSLTFLDAAELGALAAALGEPPR